MATVCSVQVVAVSVLFAGSVALEVVEKHMDVVQMLRGEQTSIHLVGVERSAVHCQRDSVAEA